MPYFAKTTKRQSLAAVQTYPNYNDMEEFIRITTKDMARKDATNLDPSRTQNPPAHAKTANERKCMPPRIKTRSVGGERKYTQVQLSSFHLSQNSSNQWGKRASRFLPMVYTAIGIHLWDRDLLRGILGPPKTPFPLKRSVG